MDEVHVVVAVVCDGGGDGGIWGGNDQGSSGVNVDGVGRVRWNEQL